jgi:uncharacterized protein YndB with AHSA1/START domain
MTDFLHSVPIQAPANKVFAAIATQDGNQGWWTHDTVLDPRVGGAAKFGFDHRAMVFRMRIEELVPEKPLVMRCSGDHPEWSGTALERSLAPPEDGGTVLHFTHRDWKAPTATLPTGRVGSQLRRGFRPLPVRNPRLTSRIAPSSSARPKGPPADRCPRCARAVSACGC